MNVGNNELTHWPHFERQVTKPMTALKKNINSLNTKTLLKITLFFVGLFSFIWILIRIIPKPSRATYPCVQAAYPFAGAFLISLASLLTSAYAYSRALIYYRRKNIVAAIGLLVVAIITGTLINHDNSESYAATYLTAVVEPNNPMGEAKGIFPGRVVWYHNPNATNENWSSKSPENYITNTNTNKDTVQEMVTASMLKLTETSSVKEAWNSLFIYFNKEHGKGAVSYKPGENIFIKCNFVSAFTQTATGPTWTSPQVIRAVLRHLINDMSVPQENIALGDPMTCVTDTYWNILHTEFPNVIYIDHSGANGRTLAKKGTQLDIIYSDKGKILRDSQGSWTFPAGSGNAVTSDTLYHIIENADYLINIAALKAHARAGVTLCAKNHFGSHVRTAAAQLHMGLPTPDGGKTTTPTRPGYNQYRIQVDLMGNRKLGGNTLLFMVDGLWGANDAGGKPEKYAMPPFNIDYPSSVFMSQDQVALESVCLDFLQGMYPTGNPQMSGVDDYLRQAADPKNWPADVVYDPENDGTPLKSLGIHEHWNNVIDKKYSKELGLSKGIEFIKLTKNTTTSIANDVIRPTEYRLEQNYPNPFNPVTKISYSIPRSSKVVLKVFDVSGREVATLENGERAAGIHPVTFDAHHLASGVYYYRLVSDGFVQTKKIVLTK